MKKIHLATICIVSFILVLSYTAWASEAPAPTFCKIIGNITAPISANTGESVEIDIRYTNLGQTGPTFIRLVSPIGNLYSYIDVSAHQTDDATKGLHMYLTMPDENVIYQVEVGNGTALNPIDVTDIDLLVILNPSCPTPDMGIVEIQFNTIYPILMYPWLIPLKGYPGQTTITTLYCKSIMDVAPTYDICYTISTNADLSVVSTTWEIDVNPDDDVDGVKWTPTYSYPLAGGQTHELELTLTIPLAEPEAEYNFWVYPTRTGLTK